MAKILVTGGSGFIGTNLVSKLIEQGYEVANIDTLPPRNKLHNDVWTRIDITDRAKTLAFVAEFSPDYCYHLAARTDLNGKELTDYSANISGVTNIVDALKMCKSLQYAVFASSMLVCQLGHSPKNDDDFCPTTIYGESKVLGELVVKKLGKLHYPWTIVRPTSIWGPWFRAPYRDFFTKIQQRLYFHPKNRVVKRNYGFVYNTVNQLISLMASESLHHSMTYLADPEPLSLKRWGDLISLELHGTRVRDLPVGIFKILACLGDVLGQIGYKKFPMNSFRLNNMSTTALFSVDSLTAISGDGPYTADEGVKITCDWIRSHDD